MWVGDYVNLNSARKSEVREGMSGSGCPVWFVQWESGHCDNNFRSEAEAINWALYS